MNNRRGGRRHGRQRGSVLLLVPAGVLVLLILGAIAVDFAIAFLGQRELSGLAAAVANDTATAALSEGRFYRGTGGGGDIEIDQGEAGRLARQAVERRAPKGVRIVFAEARATGNEVCVTLRGDVGYVFARAIPGAARGRTVEARAAATAVEGEAGTVAGSSSSC